MSAEATAPSAAAEDRARVASPAGHELTLSDHEFDEIRKFIKGLTGINMGDSKRQLIYRRLRGRLKANNISSFRGYLDCLRQGDPSELEMFSNAVTTNLTSFFREKHHFDYLAQTIVPEILATKGNNGKRLRIWSAGCSTGEEPYSIAITLKESFENLGRWDAKILCTDLDSEVLSTCKAGVYSRERVEIIPEKQLKRWFKKSRAHGDEMVKVSPELQHLTIFNQLNLMDDWPMHGRFDVIFCRNVIIYFDKPTQRALIDRFANILEDDGYLILGHSESLHNVSDRFSLLGQTVYRKTC